jgi:FtsP/CotA-like multicopper oxidase with cupredoxin domain
MAKYIEELRMVRIAIMFLVLFLAGCTVNNQMQQHENAAADHHQTDFAKHFEGSTLQFTEKKMFGVEMVIPNKRLTTGVNEIDLIVHDIKHLDIEGATVRVTPWMPEMGHGAFSAPEVQEKGGGLYTISNIVMVMGGHWELRVDIKKGKMEDRVVFDFPFIRSGELYEYIRTKTPAGYDAVIGTKNSLKELEYDMVDTKDGPVKVFKLTVRDIGFEIFPDKPMMGWGFNGQIPGPTIRATEGERIRIIVTNETADGEHTLHMHGQSKPVSMDGVPFLGQKPIKKGESYTYEFTVKNIGTSWYHCHVDSAHHVDMGMYGAFVVEPKKEKPAYDREYIMILDEWPTTHVHGHQEAAPEEGHEEHGVVTMQGESPPMHDSGAGKKKKRDWYPETYPSRQEVYDGFTINGRSFPFTEPVVVKKGEKVRIRFINVGYQQHFMHTHSHRFTVVARDGSYVDEPQQVDTIGVGPGQRLDVVFNADNPGTWPFHCHRLNHVTNENIYPGGMLTFIHYED